MIFQEKPALLSLYNAVNGTDYQDPEELTVNTLENAIYTNIQNDVSFLIDSRLNRELGDYTEFVRLVRAYQGKHPLERAVDLAMDECIRKGILKEFLERNRAEVKKVSVYEYDAEKHIRMEREEAWEEGREEGIALGEQRSNELARRLIKERRYDDLERAVNDEAYRRQLFMELGIIS